VLDGTGTPWYRADVGIRGDRIAAVGRLEGARAPRTIDAAGLYLAPGFIDLHSHSASGLAEEDLSVAQPLLAQGITLVFINPDGGGAADLADQERDLLEHGLGVNVAQYIGHGSVRREVLGMEDRAPDEAELDRMRDMVRQAMEHGAVGLSSGLFYAPGSYAELSEVVELARVAAEFGGIYSSHIRDESNYTIGVVASVEEVIHVAREAGLPGKVTHIKSLGPPVWGTSAEVVDLIERAREEDVEMWADQYPYEASSTGLAAALVPRWAQAGGQEELDRRLDDPDTRERIRSEMEENLARRGGADRLQFSRYSDDPSIEGMTLAALAAERGLDPVEMAMDLVRGGGPGVVSFNMHPDDIHRYMRQPWTATASDGGLPRMGEGAPHPRAYGAFPRKIRTYVLEDGVVDLPTAIRSMTALPAAITRLHDRGIIRPGAYADLVVFDLERLRDHATFENPHQLSEGMVHVLVNGELVIHDERFTGTLPGLMVRGPRTAGAPALD
jgi:N-acyl-D-amino-acid deacylase